MTVFAKKINGKGNLVSQVDRSLALITRDVNTSQIATSQVAKAALSMEGVNDAASNALNSAFSELSVVVESIANEIGIDRSMTTAQREAAVAAGLLSGDVRSFLAQPTTTPKVAAENMSIVFKDFGGDSVERRAYGLEAYDDRENRNAAAYSIVYNMQASRQDDFGETFFPTIVVTPDNVGFDVVARLMSVYNDVQRNISGALTNFNKTNLIRAIANPYVIQNELTRIIPVYRTQSANNFVANTVVPSYNYNLEGQSIPTAPLATGVTFDLLALSQTDQLLASGVMDETDSIDPDITLTNIYLTVPGTVGGNAATDIVKLNVENIPLSNFTYSTQNNYRVQTLNFNSTAVMVSPATTQVDGSALAVLAAITANSYTVRLQVAATGTCNIELGDTAVYGNAVSVYQITDASGNQIDLTTGTGLAIVHAFQGAKLAGYDLRAYRTNMNRRQRGQIVDVTYYTQRYNVPLRSPITAVRPVNSVDQTDAPYVQTLITATRVRLSNQAVTQLIASAQFLSQYVDARSAFGDAEGDNDPDTLGIGRFYVRPVYSQETVDMQYSLDSLTSAERAADIQSVLVNKIRDHAYRMYRDSEYMAAADALAGGKAPVPVVIVGTDPVLARYLTVTGDLRTLGGEFDVRIVSTLDERVQGKIFITFGVFDENRNTTPNPLNFGNLAWSPELVMTVQITRNGAVSKETVVQPRFRFITNLPVLSVLQVLNVPAVLNKQPVGFATVPAPTAPTTPPNINVNYF